MADVAQKSSNISVLDIRFPSDLRFSKKRFKFVHNNFPLTSVGFVIIIYINFKGDLK